MSFAGLITAAALTMAAGVAVAAATANLKTGEPIFPAGEAQARLVMATLACVLCFLAGLAL